MTHNNTFIPGQLYQVADSVRLYEYDNLIKDYYSGNQIKYKSLSNCEVVLYIQEANKETYDFIVRREQGRHPKYYPVFLYESKLYVTGNTQENIRDWFIKV